MRAFNCLAEIYRVSSLNALKIITFVLFKVASTDDGRSDSTKEKQHGLLLMGNSGIVLKNYRRVFCQPCNFYRFYRINSNFIIGPATQVRMHHLIGAVF